ncbi:MULTISPECIES: hypothetical protein [unclassified Dysgonomonas]|uniref:hypothetical protein n=1 Tax=unclassified Dysgonomonas TaxID=2630389 RepID=UPI0013EA767B|nr:MULTISPECIES: hypothetical protein [unclassified Dysgonomonas]
MKVFFIILFFVLCTISSYAQWNATGNNSTTGDLSVGGDINVSGHKLIGAAPSHYFTYDNQKMGHYALRWGEDSWSNVGSGYTFWLSSYRGMKFFTAGKPQFVILNDGNIGMGTEKPTSKLEVNGTIRAKEIKIEATGWPDFVFDREYKLPSLREVENHINEHKHLSGVPSEKEVIENGISVGEMQAKLLQKIEELTLYTIQLEKKYDELREELKELKKE